MKKIFYLFMLIFTLLSLETVKAAEVDQFTKRHLDIKDSLFYFNETANQYVDLVIRDFNQKGVRCGQDAFFDEMRKYFNNHIQGEFLKKIERDKRIDFLNLSLKESIYKDWKIWNGILLGSSVGMNKKFTISPIVRSKDIYFGLDKFEHLFGQGFQYYKSFYIKGKTDYKTILNGYRKEKILLGGGVWVNGIFSYGDLVANFNGMRFWNNFFQRNNDILGSKFNHGPYVSCKNSRWEKEKEIDFSNYFDKGVDESVNCPRTGTKKGAIKLKQAIRKLGLTCPVHSDELKQLKVKYGEFSPLLINTYGISKINL